MTFFLVVLNICHAFSHFILFGPSNFLASKLHCFSTLMSLNSRENHDINYKNAGRLECIFDVGIVKHKRFTRLQISKGEERKKVEKGLVRNRKK